MSARSGVNTRPAYYNENDPRAAAWLRELISAGHIARGIVDERSIEDVYPSDLDGFVQCHFFAGIGGWSLALRMAGVPDDYAVWTGSCPCQPFSAAGRRSGFADERHLWPHWFHLIQQCRPKIIFGEQVASALGWFDLVQDDLENEGYAVGAAIIGAHSVRAPHIRQRLYYVAYADGGGSQTRHGNLSASRHGNAAATGGSVDQLGDTSGTGSGRNSGGVPCAENRERKLRSEPNVSQPPIVWDNCDWIYCRDGKYRPVEPGSFPLVNGLPSRVGLLRGYGNAIVPHLAAAFIEAALG